MPRKRVFNNDLINVNITRISHIHTVRLKKHGEPFYSIYDRILASYLESDAKEWHELYDQKCVEAKTWMDRALVAEAKNKQMVFGSM